MILLLHIVKNFITKGKNFPLTKGGGKFFTCHIVTVDKYIIVSIGTIKAITSRTISNLLISFTPFN